MMRLKVELEKLVVIPKQAGRFHLWRRAADSEGLPAWLQELLFWDHFPLKC